MEALFCKQLFLEATSVIIKFLWGGELYNSTWSAVEVIKTEPLVFLCVTLWALSRQTHECIFRAHHPHSIKPCKVRFWVSLYSSLWYSVCDNFLPPKFLFIYSKTDIWLVHLWVVACLNDGQFWENWYTIWYPSYVPLSKSDEKLRGQKNITGGTTAPALPAWKRLN